jgi:hypothetical protein
MGPIFQLMAESPANRSPTCNGWSTEKLSSFWDDTLRSDGHWMKLQKNDFKKIYDQLN